MTTVEQIDWWQANCVFLCSDSWWISDQGVFWEGNSFLKDPFSDTWGFWQVKIFKKREERSKSKFQCSQRAHVHIPTNAASMDSECRSFWLRVSIFILSHTTLWLEQINFPTHSTNNLSCLLSSLFALQTTQLAGSLQSSQQQECTTS